MSSLDRLIVSARPSLRSISPASFWNAIVFSALNVIIALGLFFWHPTVFPLVAPNQTMMTIWAIIFAVVGILMAESLKHKWWERLRSVNLTALLFKCMWSVALLFRVQDGGTLIIAALFIGLGALQAVSIIYFYAPVEVENGQKVIT